jgi:hypothetical protein
MTRSKLWKAAAQVIRRTIFLTFSDSIIDSAFFVRDRRSDTDLAGKWSDEIRCSIELSRRPGRNGPAEGLPRVARGQSIKQPELCPRRVCQGRAGAAFPSHR